MQYSTDITSQHHTMWYNKEMNMCLRKIRYPCIIVNKANKTKNYLPHDLTILSIVEYTCLRDEAVGTPHCIKHFQHPDLYSTLSRHCQTQTKKETIKIKYLKAREKAD